MDSDFRKEDYFCGEGLNGTKGLEGQVKWVFRREYFAALEDGRRAMRRPKSRKPSGKSGVLHDGKHRCFLVMAGQPRVDCSFIAATEEA
jgi:hypothetical protein